MNIVIPETLFNSLKIIIKYQNTLLLKEISNEHNLKLSELKKSYLKDENIEILVKKYNKKQKKKKVLEENVEANVVAKEEANVEENVVAKEEANVVAKEENVVAKEATVVAKEATVVAKEVVKEEEKVATVVAKEAKKIKKIKKIKKKVLEEPIEKLKINCHKYIFDNNEFYVNIENDNVYDINMEFVGKKLGNSINFKGEEN